MYRSRDLSRKEKLPENILARPYTKKTSTANHSNPLLNRTKRTAPAPKLPEADDLDAAEKLEMEMDADADAEVKEYMGADLDNLYRIGMNGMKEEAAAIYRVSKVTFHIESKSF
jgi:hypothetical protein